MQAVKFVRQSRPSGIFGFATNVVTSNQRGNHYAEPAHFGPMQRSTLDAS